MHITGLDYPGPAQREDRFTAPTDLCPHPGRWTSTDGDSTEVEVSDLAYGLVRTLQPNFCIETGAGWGQTTRRIGQALMLNGHGHLVALETDRERVDHAADRCAGLPVKVLPFDSMDWSPDELIDFAWLDSLYELRVPEFTRYRPRMRAGTVVCFHDTAPEHGSHRITSGRDLRSEIEAELGWQVRLVHLPTPRGVTVAEVL